jgi:hypothetical protein
MNLKRLQGFHAVIESGSVTNAAQRLHMTQPALSRIIRDLEEELGGNNPPAEPGALSYGAARSGPWGR